MTTRVQRTLALWWLALALVLAPTLGRMHQVVHAQALAGGVGYVSAHAHVHADGAHAPAGAMDTAHALFNGHAGADCQVLDQQLLGGAPLVQALALPAALPAATPQARHHAAGGARWLASFQARGPPARA